MTQDATPEKSVADYRDRHDWLEVRRTGIGGSDVGAICGVDRFRTPADVYDEKVSPVLDAPPNLDMLRGRLYEPLAVQLYVEATGRMVRRQPLRRHKEHAFMLVSMDRQQLNDPRGPGYAEVKCPSIQVFAKMKAQGLPPTYVLQLQHGLEVADYEWGTFVVYDCVRPRVIHFDVERDREIGAFLVETEREFWGYVQRGERPAVQLVHDLPEMPAVPGEVVTRNDPEWAEAIGTLREAKSLSDTAEFLESQAKDAIKALLGGYGVAEGAGARVYHRQMPGRTSFDKKALAAARPLDRLGVVLALTEVLSQALVDDPILHQRIATALEAELANAALDLSQFEKQGMPFDEFRSYMLKAGAED